MVNPNNTTVLEVIAVAAIKKMQFVSGSDLLTAENYTSKNVLCLP